MDLYLAVRISDFASVVAKFLVKIGLAYVALRIVWYMIFDGTPAVIEAIDGLAPGQEPNTDADPAGPPEST
ncbi:MAG: hypothetical protein OXQ90_01630 [Gammaproteobacteria bacterium]|nr:hypothetical protein [Gammaproteobacteria bacterium]